MNSRETHLLDYDHKQKGYYESTRLEMLKYIPKETTKSLEFGCGDGGFSFYLKEKMNIEAWAVEIEPCAAQKAAKVLDKVINDDALISLDKLPDHYFDCVLFFDTIEHLVNPYTLLSKLKSKLSKDGVVISSIPNIRYYRVFKKYVLQGDWEYEDHGIMDKTHFRFFTKKSIINMFTCLNYEIQEIEGIHPTSSRTYKIMNCLSLNAFADVRYKHFAVVAKPM